jgi:hypothetical protein
VPLAAHSVVLALCAAAEMGPGYVASICQIRIVI